MKKTLAITLLAICCGVTLGTAIEASPVITETKADFNELKHDALLALDNTFTQIEREKDLYLINFDNISNAYVEGIEVIQDATTAEEVNSALSHYRSLMVSFPPDDVIVDTFGDEINEISRFLTVDLDIEAFIYSAVDLANRIKPIYEEFGEDIPGLTLLWEKVSFMEACVSGYSSLLELQATVEEYAVSAEVKTNVSNFIYGTTIDYYENNFGSLTVESEFEQFEADIKTLAKSVFDNLENLNNLPDLIATGFDSLDNTNEFSAYLDDVKRIYENCLSAVVVSKEITDNYNLLIESYDYYVELCNYVESYENCFDTYDFNNLIDLLNVAKSQFRSKEFTHSFVYENTMRQLVFLVNRYEAILSFKNYKDSHFNILYYGSYRNRFEELEEQFFDDLKNTAQEDYTTLLETYYGYINDINSVYDSAFELKTLLSQLCNFEYTEAYKTKLDRTKEISDTLPDDIFNELISTEYEHNNIANFLWDNFDSIWNAYLELKPNMSTDSRTGFESDFNSLVGVAKENYKRGQEYFDFMEEEFAKLNLKLIKYQGIDAINAITTYANNNKKSGANEHFDGLYNAEIEEILEKYKNAISEETTVEGIELLREEFESEISALDGLYDECIAFAELYDSVEFEYSEEFKKLVSHALGEWEKRSDKAKEWISANYNISKLSGFQLNYLSLKSLMNNYMNEYQGVSDAIDDQFEIMFNEAIELCKVDDPNAGYYISCISQRLYYMVEFRNYTNTHVNHELINSTEIYKEKFDEVLDEAYDAIRTADYSQLLPTVGECTKKVEDFIEDLKEIEDIKAKIQSIKEFEYFSLTLTTINDLLSRYEKESDFVKEIIGDDIKYVLLAKQAYEALDNIDYSYYNTYRNYMTDEQREHFFDLFDGLIRSLREMIPDKENIDSVINSATTEITEYFEYCEELYKAKKETNDYIIYAVQHTEGLYLLDNQEEIFNAWHDRVRNATNVSELDVITSEITEFMNRQLAKFEIDQAMSHFGFHYDDELIKSHVEDWYSSLELVTTKDDCLAIADRAREEIRSIYQDLAKQEIEDYLAGLDQSFWTDEMKEKTEKGKQSYFDKIDKAETYNEINRIVKEAKNKLGRYAKPETREEKGCNKGTGAIVIISIVVIVAVTLTICLTAGKKGKKETKKSKK